MGTDLSLDTAFRAINTTGSQTPQRNFCHRHTIQLYEQDNAFLDTLTQTLGAALSAGDAVIVVATEAHRDALATALKARGLNLALAEFNNRYIALDAEETLARFMVNGWPDATRFTSLAQSMLERAKAAARFKQSTVIAFGEMTNILWMQGDVDAAIKLEQLWNDLAETHSFTLYCAYPLKLFADPSHTEAMQRVFSEHSHVIPAESYLSLKTEGERMRTVAMLQQRAQGFEALARERETLVVALAIELEDMRRLHQTATRLSWMNLEETLQRIVLAVADMQNTNMGMVSLYEPENDLIRVAASVGLSADFLRNVSVVRPGTGGFSKCLQRFERVIVEDTEHDSAFADCRQGARIAGFRALHCTPLLNVAGNVLGVLTVQFRNPHRPTERQIRLTDLYARLAVNAIENASLYQKAQAEIIRRNKVQEALLRAEKLATTGRLATAVVNRLYRGGRKALEPG